MKNRSLLVTGALLIALATGLARAAEPPVYPGDKAAFVRDVTLPDNDGVPEVTVKPGAELIKTWRIKNVGTVPWANRWLRPVASTAGEDHLKTIKPVKIPDTEPGKTCDITSVLKAASVKGVLKVTYKQTDDKGKVLLPGQGGVWLAVNVQ
jgi:hypothetical protein